MHNINILLIQVSIPGDADIKHIQSPTSAWGSKGWRDGGSECCGFSNGNLCVKKGVAVYIGIVGE